VARTGPWDIAGLDVQTDDRGSIPSENLGVARIRRRILNPFSFAGTMVTSRIARGGQYNVGTGLDAYIKVVGEEYLTIRGATTFDDADGSPTLLGRSQLYAQWQRRSTRGLTYFAQFHRVGADYRPGLGFLPRQDFTRLALFSEYYIHSARSALRTHGPGAIGYAFLRNGGHSLETSYLAFWWHYGFRSGAEGWLEVIHHYEDVRTAFPLGDGVAVESGEHQFAELWFNFQPPPGPKVRALIDARIGGFYDGWRTQVHVEPTWNLSRHLELGGVYELNRIRFPDRDTGLDIHLVRLRIGAAANARLSATAFVQLNSVEDRVGVNFRLRYNLREGSDVWLVYDEGFNTDRDALPGTPRLPLSAVRFFRVKVTHTFVP
jgi:hypothetical protein